LGRPGACDRKGARVRELVSELEEEIMELVEGKGDA